MSSSSDSLLSSQARSRRSRREINYLDIENGESVRPAGTDFRCMISNFDANFLDPDGVVSYVDSGAHLDADYFESNGFENPLVIRDYNSIKGFRIPDRAQFAVQNVMEIVGMSSLFCPQKINFINFQYFYQF